MNRAKAPWPMALGGRLAMAQGPKGAEMAAMASRIDCAGRSGVGRYVRTSGGPFVASKGKHGNCHTLPYVAIRCPM